MRIKVKTLAGMAACLMGVLATASCSKEEFFGLEDSVYLDNSLKTEIAMSQVYADYAIACYNLIKEMNQPLDTASMQIQGVVDGKPIYFKTESSKEYLLVLMEKLKNAYPELANADKLDFDEIQEIAISKNKALKGLFPQKNTKKIVYWGWNNSHTWVYSATAGEEINEFYYDDWWFKAFDYEFQALNHVIWFLGEGTGEDFTFGGGLFFPDHSAVAMLSYGELEWPSITSGYGGPNAEYDFIVIPCDNLTQFEVYNFAYDLGPNYYRSGRTHFVYDLEMQCISFFM